jgi:DNA-binding IclR family transcriptional regulator
MGKAKFPAHEGVTAVARALVILDAFTANETALTRGEVRRRTKLPKTTVLRIMRSLAAARYLVQLPEGAWRLGPAAGWLGSRYHASFDRTACIEPVLRELARETGETAIFSVREGDTRVCVARVLGPHPLRHHVRVGEIRPVDRGAPGRILLAFSGKPGATYDAIRRKGYHITFGERDPLVAAVALPVFGVNHALIGCVSVSGPIARLTPVAITRHVRWLRKAAGQLTYELGRTAAGLSSVSDREY